MSKLNCWEFMRCGREPGGEKISELGVCPVATDKRVHGVNGGRFGGRTCWAVAAAFRDELSRGRAPARQADCGGCLFYKFVASEEGENLAPPIDVMIHLSSPRKT